MRDLFIFITGCTIGSVITWRFIDSKYRRIVDDEIEEVREYYNDKLSDKEIVNENTQVTAESIKNESKPDISEYTKMLKNSDYLYNHTDYDNVSKNHKKEESINIEDFQEDIEPYVISPDEFGMKDDYETISLTYFDDDVLADDKYELVDNVDEKIGWENLSHFGDYEDDAVHIRNEKTKVDYEILKVMDNWKDIHNL